MGIKRTSVERRGVGRSKPALAFVRGNIKGKEKRASARHTRRQRSRRRRGRSEEEEEEEQESVDTREESEFKVGRGKRKRDPKAVEREKRDMEGCRREQKGET